MIDYIEALGFKVLTEANKDKKIYKEVVINEENNNVAVSSNISI